MRANVQADRTPRAVDAGDRAGRLGAALLRRNQTARQPGRDDAGQDASPQAIALNAQYGFNQPAIIQYLHWLGNALRGDLGRSYTTQQSVAAAIALRLPVTLELSFWSIGLAVIAAVASNTIPAMRGRWQGVVTAANLIGITVPNFMLGASR